MFIPKEEYSNIQAVLPILCVDCLIIHENKCLLLRRAREPAKGQYWFPGGRIYKMESIEEAALRKAKEEVNLECYFERIVSIEETFFKQTGDMHCDVHTINICCVLSLSSSDSLKIDDLHSDYIWSTCYSIKRMDLHPAVRIPLTKCLETKARLE
jgi:colanic acid biosynthesis protein WcaH